MVVFYEDNHIIVCEKPQNIPSQLDISGDKDMLNIVKDYIKQKYNKPGNVYVGLVHRLDRPTGGIMVFAKTSKAASRLGEQIKNKDFEKYYLTIVNGILESGTHVIKSYLKKDEKNNCVSVVSQSEVNSKYAELEYTTISSKNNLSLALVKLKTGRSHQIRVQMKSIGHTLVGDCKYGNNINNSNLALWSYKLSFIHPTLKNKMTFTSFPNVKEFAWNVFESEINNLK